MSMLGNISVVDDFVHTSTVIKVIGVGGGGSNAINRMIACGVKDVQFLAANTDHQALARSQAEVKIPLGRNRTKGLGAGGKPEVGAAAAEEDVEALRSYLAGADMVFVTAGMGGGTGTGAAPVIARVAKEIGALTVAVVTKPFSYEGAHKMKQANEGIDKLSKAVDTLIVIPNDKILSTMEARSPIREAMMRADDVLRMGVQGIADIITIPGEINIDFADVKSIMEGRGAALMGIGRGKGENRAVDAVTSAINNPFLDGICIEGAKGILVNIVLGPDGAMDEINEIMGILTQNADADCNIIHGYAIQDALKDEIQVTVIATGFQQEVPVKIETLSPADQDTAAAGQAAAAAAGKSKAGSEYLSSNEFNNVLGSGRSPANPYLGPRAGEENLEVPTFLRQRLRGMTK